LPVKLHHEPPQRAEKDHKKHVAETVFHGEAAEINQEKKEGNKISALHERNLGELV
jgi:hypothetical protein